MLIREFIEHVTVDESSRRLARLKEMRAPRLMIEAAEQELADLFTKEIECGGETHLLDEHLETYEVKIGGGGKKYYSFNFGSINYFPSAKYGRYIKSVD